MKIVLDSLASEKSGKERSDTTKINFTQTLTSYNG